MRALLRLALAITLTVTGTAAAAITPAQAADPLRITAAGDFGADATAAAVLRDTVSTRWASSASSSSTPTATSTSSTRTSTTASATGSVTGSTTTQASRTRPTTATETTGTTTGTGMTGTAPQSAPRTDSVDLVEPAPIDVSAPVGWVTVGASSG